MTETLGERRLEAMGIGPPFEHFRIHRPPVGEGAHVDIREGIIGSRRRVVAQVQVVGGLLAAPTREDIVGLDRHRGPELSLHADRCLMAVGQPAPRVVDLVEELAPHAASPIVDVARVGKDGLIGGQRPVERVDGEIGAAIVAQFGDGRDRVNRRLVSAVGHRLCIEPPVAATHHRAVVQTERKPKPRRHIVPVVRKVTRQPWQQLDFLGIRSGLQVPAHPKVERQAGRDRPVILQPCGRHVLGSVATELRFRHRLTDLCDDRRQRREVPGGQVVPHRNERLDVGGRSAVPGEKLRETVVAPLTAVLVADVLAAQLHDVPATSVVAAGEVIANRVEVLPVVAVPGTPERIAAERDPRRAPAADRIVGDAAALPFHERITVAVEQRIAALQLVDRRIAEDLGQRSQELAAVGMLLERRRRMRRRAAAIEEDLVVVLVARGQPRLRRELHVEPRPALVLPARVGLIDIEGRVRTVYVTVCGSRSYS